MTDEKTEQLKRAHEKLYVLIPETPFKCIEGCKDCCGPVVCSSYERSLQPDVPETDSIYCAFAGKDGCEGCSIHKDRPLMCRLFGVGEGMKCPHFDYTPALSKKQVGEIIQTYSKLMNTPPLMTKGVSKNWKEKVAKAKSK